MTSATVDYDLGSILTIDRLALWNEEFSGFGSGSLSTSLDGVTFSGLTTINPVDSPSNLDYGAQVFGLGTVSIRFVRFEISGCPQPDGNALPVCGIGEVAFSTASNDIPLPATLPLVVIGLIGLGALRRRQRMSA